MSKRLTIALLLITGVMAGHARAQSLVEIDPASVQTGHVYLFENVTATNVMDDSANNHMLNVIGEPQLVAGLKGYYTAEQLVGRNIIVVTNLAPRMMRGQESQGMLLAASTPDQSQVVLLTTAEEIAPGSAVS